MDQKLQSLTVLLVSNLEQSHAFYNKILGCEVTEWGVIRKDSVRIGIKLVQAKQKEHIHPNSPNRFEIICDLYAFTDNYSTLDQLFVEWSQKGAYIVQEPEVTQYKWGQWKEFAVRDPDGYIIGVGTSKDACNIKE